MESRYVWFGWDKKAAQAPCSFCCCCGGRCSCFCHCLPCCSCQPHDEDDEADAAVAGGTASASTLRAVPLALPAVVPVAVAFACNGFAFPLDAEAGDTALKFTLQPPLTSI